MKRRSGFQVMARLIGLVKPLTGFMVLAILMGLVGHLCAAFLTVLGGYGVLGLLGFSVPLSLGWIFGGHSPVRPGPGAAAVWGAGLQPLYRL